MSDPVRQTLNILENITQDKNDAEVSSFLNSHSHWQQGRGILLLTLSWNYLTVFRRVETHKWYTLGLFLPLVTQFGGLAQVLYFDAFSVGDATRERVGGGSRLFDLPSQAPQTLIHRCIGSCMFFGGSSAIFSLRTRFLLCIRRFTLEFGGPLARLLQNGACFYVEYLAVANLPEGAVQIRPAMCVPLGGGNHALTRGLQLVLQTVHGLEGNREQHATFLSLVRHSVFFLCVEPEIPSDCLRGAAVPTVSFPLESVAFTGSEAFPFESSTVSPPSSVPTSPPRCLSCPSNAPPSVSFAESRALPSSQWLCLPSYSAGFPRGPACSIQNSCFSRSGACSWMVTIHCRTTTKNVHFRVSSGTSRSK